MHSTSISISIQEEVMRRFNQPSLVAAERTWTSLREEIESFERSGDLPRLNRARGELRIFEQEHSGVDFIKLEAQFDKREPKLNLADAERRWWELRASLEDFPDRSPGRLKSESALRNFELDQPELDLPDLRVRFESYFQPPVNRG